MPSGTALIRDLLNRYAHQDNGINCTKRYQQLHKLTFADINKLQSMLAPSQISLTMRQYRTHLQAVAMLFNDTRILHNGNLFSDNDNHFPPNDNLSANKQYKIPCYRPRIGGRMENFAVTSVIKCALISDIS